MVEGDLPLLLLELPRLPVLDHPFIAHRKLVARHESIV